MAPTYFLRDAVECARLACVADPRVRADEGLEWSHLLQARELQASGYRAIRLPKFVASSSFTVSSDHYSIQSYLQCNHTVRLNTVIIALLVSGICSDTSGPFLMKLE